jgi:hypothetical protein
MLLRSFLFLNVAIRANCLGSCSASRPILPSTEPPSPCTWLSISAGSFAFATPVPTITSLG